MPQVGESVYRFWKEMEAQGLTDCVTLFTASDGREGGEKAAGDISSDDLDGKANS
jgi:hypothetical protein